MQELKQRTFLFAVAVGKVINELPYNIINKAYCSQLIRCSSSIGANYRAARRGKSSADFLNKLKIVEEEADETIYFLELLKEFNQDFEEQLIVLVNEATEILKIIVASILKIKASMNEIK